MRVFGRADAAGQHSMSRLGPFGLPCWRPFGLRVGTSVEPGGTRIGLKGASLNAATPARFKLGMGHLADLLCQAGLVAMRFWFA